MQHRTSISDGASGSGAQSMTGLPLDRFQRIEPDPESEVLRVLQRGNALFDRRGGREQLADAAGKAHGGHALWERSGEGRGGEEGRIRWGPDYLKKKKIFGEGRRGFGSNMVGDFTGWMRSIDHRTSLVLVSYDMVIGDSRTSEQAARTRSVDLLGRG